MLRSGAEMPVVRTSHAQRMPEPVAARKVGSGGYVRG